MQMTSVRVQSEGHTFQVALTLNTHKTMDLLSNMKIHTFISNEFEVRLGLRFWGNGLGYC